LSNGGTTIDGLSIDGLLGGFYPRRCARGAAQHDLEDADRPGNIFNRYFAQILERAIELVAHLIARRPRDTNPDRLGQALEAGRDIDSVAEDVVRLGDDIAKINADAKQRPLVFRDAGGAFGHGHLHLDGAAHGIDDAGELDQEPVAGGFYDAPVMGDYLAVEQLRAQRIEARQGARLIGRHHAAITDNIGGKDRREPPLLPSLRRLPRPCS
jgi:hypothetical protein